MKWLNNLSTTKKLMGAFGLLVLLTALVGYKGIDSVKRENEHLAIYEGHTFGALALKEAQVKLIELSRAVVNAILDEDESSIRKGISDSAHYEKDFLKNFEQYAKSIVTAEAKAKAAEAEKLFKDLRPAQNYIMELALAHKDKEARAGLPKIRAQADTIDKLFDELVKSKDQVLNKLEHEAEADYLNSHNFIIGLTVLAALMGLGIGYFIARLIAQPLNQSVGVLQAVAEGDFTQRLELDRRDEVGQMAAALNKSLEAISSAFGAIAHNANSSREPRRRS